MPGRHKYICYRGILKMLQGKGLSQIPSNIKDAVVSFVWATEKPGRMRSAEPVKLQLKTGTRPVRTKQYPIKLEARKTLEPVTDNFLQYGLLRECQSEYNTSIFKTLKGVSGNGWCRLWIPNYGLMAKPQYEAVKGLGELLEWTLESRQGFDNIRRALMKAPTLGLPNLTIYS